MRKIAVVLTLLTLAAGLAANASAADTDTTSGDEAAAQGQQGDQGSGQTDPEPQITGSVNLGAVTTSGNTESESINGALDAEIGFAVWRHSAELTAYRSSEDQVTVAERYSAALQSDYKFSQRSYLFANANYRIDRFGAFEESYAGVVGLGRRFVDTQGIRLDLEVGAGRRVQDPEGEPDREGETVGRFNGEFQWAFSDSASFTQTLSVESGDSNTYSESVTAIKSQLTGALSLRLAHTIQNNSEVPEGTENTDRISTVSVEYGF